ncbi:hypothetical protein TGAMA5MH_11099 [Trichoderma gamsii]|uniref:Uncharacterized protein n=1 Tax=Trichoderma gamsii TaxID=398673 RepID=A0A2K0SUQ5_9HYPO|nr:hypothetical protein TGAMA5MH_11099 [Trichoderma gamsii]
MKGFCMVEEDRGLRGFVNLALEYDSSWIDGFMENITLTRLSSEKSPRGLLILTLFSMDDKDLAYTPETLWLIDYNLKRDNYKSDRVTSSEDQVFHGSNKRFVQVLNSREYLGTYKNSALDFLDNVRKLFDSHGPHYDSCLRHTGTYNHNGCIGCLFGLSIMKYSLQVLACEDVE